ncbi:MAG TPA: DUF4169 family protein [Rhabdaerophilum sp.]|nr:DUF4169 family protein [Rhabdaerophilum sp.]
MGEVINLRLARKAKARVEAERKAEENRAKFGQAKATRKLNAAERKRAEKAHDAGRIDKEE